MFIIKFLYNKLVVKSNEMCFPFFQLMEHREATFLVIATKNTPEKTLSKYKVLFTTVLTLCRASSGELFYVDIIIISRAFQMG